MLAHPSCPICTPCCCSDPAVTLVGCGWGGGDELRKLRKLWKEEEEGEQGLESQCKPQLRAAAAPAPLEELLAAQLLEPAADVAWNAQVAHVAGNQEDNLRCNM